MKRPIIGIVSNDRENFDGWFLLEKIYYVVAPAADAVRLAGGLPLLLPITSSLDDMDEYLNMLDGVMFTGGHDINPEYYGEDVRVDCHNLHPDMDYFDINLFKKTMERKIPTISMCRGTQVANVAMGGTLFQDVNVETRTTIKHSASREGSMLVHDINILKPDSMFSQLTGLKGLTRVNSIHHQAIDALADHFEVVARASDDVIEIIELKDKTHFYVGTQFHPEILTYYGNKDMIKLIEGFVQAAFDYGVHKRQAAFLEKLKTTRAKIQSKEPTSK